MRKNRFDSFIGIDLGLFSDATSIIIGRMDSDGQITIIDAYQIKKAALNEEE